MPTHTARCGAAAVEHLHGRPEALVLAPAEEGVFGHMAIGEDHIGGVRPLLPHLPIDLAERQPRRFRLHQEGRDASGVAGFRIGAGEDGEKAGFGRVGDVALGSIEDPAPVLAPCRGAKRARVGADVRLG
jgi:hypothetical protein